MLKSSEYDPVADGKKKFYKNVRGVTTFSSQQYFKTVFYSGDNVVADMEEIKK